MHNPQRKRSVTVLSLPEDKIYVSIIRKAIMSTTIPEAPRLLGLLRGRRFAELLEWASTISPQLYVRAPDYYGAVQVSSLIKKYPFSETEVPGLDPERTALKTFYAAEHRCKRVNLKLRLRRRRFNPYAQQWEYARSYIRRVLGETPDYAACLDLCDFSSGASLGVHGNKTNLARKLISEDWSMTPVAQPYVMSALWNNIQVRDTILPGGIKCYDRDLFRDTVRERIHTVHYNKLSFVPKTTYTHRGIAVEPLLNGFVQKGIDTYMRRRLRRVGIDLSDQTRNQRLSCEGSGGGFNPYSTVDLSAASDSISVELVKDLLPPEWFEFLYGVRPTHYLAPNSFLPQRYEKFCSMGNGFCFPLESLLFAALTYAANKDSIVEPMDFSVYGDDIIVRQSQALLLIELLRDAGFRTNVTKTFIHGPFRESCGADWFLKQDVRPVILDTRLSDLRQVMSLHNSFLRSRTTELFSQEIRQYLLSLSPVKYYRPGREPGDTCFSVPLDIALTSPLTWFCKKSFRIKWKEILSLPVNDNEMCGATIPFVDWCAFIRGANPEGLYTLRYSSKVKVSQISRPWRDSYHGLSFAFSNEMVDQSYHRVTKNGRTVRTLSS